MKKRIGYLLLIATAIIGSRLLYGINYSLNTDKKIDDNLYRFNIVNNKDFLDMKLDGNYLYLLTSDTFDNNHGENLEYTFTKYDLSNSVIVNEYHFINKEMLYPIKIFKKNNYLYLTSLYNNTYYQFNKKLELISEYKGENSFNASYGLFNNQTFEVVNNKIYYNNLLYDELPSNCGYLGEIIYSNDTYIRFYNYNKNLGCLYNMDNKRIYYIDFENIDASSNNYLEYQNNSLKFRYNNEFYYLNDITENYNLKMHKNGDYLFTYDNTNNTLRIYNLETKKIIYEKQKEAFKNSVISNVNIDDYVYFTVKDNYNTYIYIWDYLKSDRLNKDMILQDEKEYKFENDRLLNEIKETYNVNIYLYDKAVKHFDDIYVIPVYDEVLINSRLKTIKKVLDENNYFNNNEISIYFEKEIFGVNGKNTNKSYTTYINEKHSIIISLLDSNFEQNILKLLIKLP